MRFQASHRFARIAPRKVKLVMDQVRGLGINEALETLKISRRRAARMVDKVLRSALANAEFIIAEKNLDLDVANLVVADARSNEGPKLKRWLTRARGMATPIWRRMSHLHVALSPREEE